jgi:hypothetical protein
MHNGWVQGAGSPATERQKRVLDRHRRGNVVTDGEIVDSEAHGRTCDVPGEAGTHALSAGHRWWASPVLSVAVQQGETVRFARRPRPHPVIQSHVGLHRCIAASLHRCIAASLHRCIAASTEHIHHTGVCKGRSSPRPDDQRRPSYGCLNASRDPFIPHTKYEICPKKLMTMPSVQRHFGPGI